MRQGTATRGLGGHYIPVGAKRRALEIYRDRRRGFGDPCDPTPLPPLDAMRSTLEFFAGAMAFKVAYEGTAPKDMVDGYRAAWVYLHQMYRGQCRALEIYPRRLV